MAKKPPPNLRRRQLGNDASLGPHLEARIRRDSLMGPSSQSLPASTVKEYAVPPPQWSELASQLWRYTMMPETLRWVYISRIVGNVAGNIVGIRSKNIAIYTVNKSQVLTILEWTPMLLTFDPSRPLLLQAINQDDDAWGLAMGAELRVSYTAPLNASSIYSLDTTKYAPPQFAVAGTHRMNKLGYVASTAHPFSVYADENTDVSTVFSSGVSANGTTLTFDQLPGFSTINTESPLMGARIFGFIMSKSNFQDIVGKVRHG